MAQLFHFGTGFHTPSPIQREAVPLALEGHDLVGVAATGSGKSLAGLDGLDGFECVAEAD